MTTDMACMRNTRGDYSVASFMMYDDVNGGMGFVTLVNGSDGEHSSQCDLVIHRIN